MSSVKVDNQTNFAAQPPDWSALVADGIEEILFAIDTEWRFTYFNAHAKYMFGLFRPVFIGDILWDAIPALIGTDTEQMYRKVMETKQHDHLETFWDQANAWFDVRAYAIPHGMVIYLKDISLRKTAEAALQQQAEYAQIQATIAQALAAATSDYQATLDTAARSLGQVIGDTCIIGLITADGTLVENVASYRANPTEAALVRTLLPQIPLPKHQPFAQPLLQAGQAIYIPVTTPQELFNGTSTAFARYNEYFSVHSIMTVPLRAQGQLLGIVTMLRDTPNNSYTPQQLSLLQDLADRVALAIANARLLQQVRHQLDERTRLQHELLQAQKMESIGRLAGGIAHDFNNLLTAITGFSEMALATLAVTDQAFVEIVGVQRAASRATALTRQLLTFSRQQVISPQPVSVNTTIVEISQLLSRAIGEDIEWRVTLDPNLGLIYADPTQLEQIIINLALNARDAMPNGGTLHVETTVLVLDDQHDLVQTSTLATGTYGVIVIRDTGTGMDAATQARIFEPFFTTKPPGQGTGLGLSTVYGIVQESHGTIQVHSVLGSGTTFTILLPYAQEGIRIQPTLPPDEDHVLTADTASIILVVEDDPLVRELIHRILHQAGYITLDAHNGKQALELLMKPGVHVDLIVSDVVMPQMSGRKLIEQLHAQQRFPKVLCISGHAHRGLLGSETLHLWDGFLQKPFTPRALLQHVMRTLAEKRE